MSYLQELRRLVGTRPLLLPSVMVLILDESGQVLMQERTGTGAWHVPGGFLELGETPEEAARREVLEETALTVGTLELAGAYAGPEFHWTYPNGDEVYNVTIAYLARDCRGVPVADGEEGKKVAFFPLAHLPEELGPPARPVLRDLQQRGIL